MRATVSACMIVRDEQENLPACLAGLDTLFDEIIVLDTGSTDQTREVARSLGAKVYEFQWCDDFAAARNASRSHATGDWIFWLDADDRIDSDEIAKMRQLFDRLPPADQPAPVYVMTCRSNTPHANSQFEIAHTRLFRNRSDLRWRGRIHEYLVREDAQGEPGSVRDLLPSEIAYTDITIRHDGYSDPQVWAAKQLRDLRILSREYLLNPDDPLTPFYIGRSLASQSRTVEAVQWFQRSIAVDPTGRRSSTPKAYVLLMKCLVAIGRIDDAVRAADQAMTALPPNFELRFECGSLYLSTGRLTDAESCFRSLIGRSIDDERRAGLPLSMTPAAARRMLAEVMIQRGAPAPAADLLRQVVKEEPTQTAAWLLLGELALTSQYRQEADQAIQALSRIPGATYELHLLRAIRACANRHYAEAVHDANHAIKLQTGLPAGWIVLGRALEGEARRFDAAAQAYERALAINPRLQHLKQDVARMRVAAGAMSPSRIASSRMDERRPQAAEMPSGMPATSDGYIPNAQPSAFGGAA